MDIPQAQPVLAAVVAAVVVVQLARTAQVLQVAMAQGEVKLLRVVAVAAARVAQQVLYREAPLVVPVVPVAAVLPEGLVAHQPKQVLMVLAVVAETGPTIPQMTQEAMVVPAQNGMQHTAQEAEEAVVGIHHHQTKAVAVREACMAAAVAVPIKT